MQNQDLVNQDEISSITSLLRTFLPDDEDLPFTSSTEQLLRKVGGSLNYFNRNDPDLTEQSNGLCSHPKAKRTLQIKVKKKNKGKEKKHKMSIKKDSKSKTNPNISCSKNESTTTCNTEEQVGEVTMFLSDKVEPESKQSTESEQNFQFPPGCIKKMACFLCDETFNTMAVYSSHMIIHCQEAASVKCSDCNEIFSNKAQFSSHRRLSTFEVWVDRSKANEIASTEREEEKVEENPFKAKKKKKRGEIDDSYICNVCGKTLHKYHSYLKHVRAHNDSQGFQCAVCQESFLAPCLLRNHIDLQHSHVLPFQCRRCLRRFKMKSSLSTHMKFCDVEPGSLPFAEEMQFIDQLSQQRKYMGSESDDAGLSQYSCPICTVMFDSPEELQKHMNYHDETKPYKCEECGRGFRSKRMLQKHSSLHKTGHDCKCEICGVQLITRSGYNAHLRGHRNQEIIQATFLPDSNQETSSENTSSEPALEILQRLKEKNENKSEVLQSPVDETPDPNKLSSPKSKPKNYSCPFCGMKFFSGGAKFQAHARKAHKEGEFIKCNLCSKSFLGKENLERHLKLHKMYTETFPCEECGKTFRRKYALIVHKKMHTFKKFVKCDICGQEFRFVSEVDKHKNTKHRYDRMLNIYKCNICGQRFPMLSHLSVHCYCHNLHDSKPFECDLCKISFKTSIELKQHIFKKHDELMKRLGDSTYIPDTGTFLTFSSTKVSGFDGIIVKQEHVEHDGNDTDDTEIIGPPSPKDNICASKTPVKCVPSEETVLQLNESSVKLEAENEEDGRLPSNVEAYNWATRQFSHQAKILKRWTCEVCQKAFSSNSDLKTHRRTHSGETPFKCDFCDRSFKQRGHRKLHIQVVHTKDMPFKCGQCESAFPTRYRYQVHLKRHTGVKEHQCSYCDKGYYTLGKLNEHKKKRHTAEWDEELVHKACGDE